MAGHRPNDRGVSAASQHLLPGPDTGQGGRATVLSSSAPQAIEWTSERIAGGGVIALPTDTVYGIAASLSFPDALDRIFTVKGRPDDRTLPVLVSSSEMVTKLAEDVDQTVVLLLDRYWPGPLTVVVPARAGMPERAIGPGHTVGLRMPNHPLALEVIARAGGSIACTSANRSGEQPALTAQEVADAFGGTLDLILDGGRSPGGVASTVVAVEGDSIRLLRNGAIPSEHLLDTWRQLRAG